jgi:hypothetical protein
MSVPVNKVKAYWTDDGRFIWSFDHPTPPDFYKDAPDLVETIKEIERKLKEHAETVVTEPAKPCSMDDYVEYMKNLKDKPPSPAYEQQEDNDKSDSFVIRMREEEYRKQLERISEEVQFPEEAVRESLEQRQRNQEFLESMRESSRPRESFRHPALEQERLTGYATTEQFEEVIEGLKDLREITIEILSRLRPPGL